MKGNIIFSLMKRELEINPKLTVKEFVEILKAI